MADSVIFNSPLLILGFAAALALCLFSLVKKAGFAATLFPCSYLYVRPLMLSFWAPRSKKSGSWQYFFSASTCSPHGGGGEINEFQFA